MLQVCSTRVGPWTQVASWWLVLLVMLCSIRAIVCLFQLLQDQTRAKVRPLVGTWVEPIKAAKCPNKGDHMIELSLFFAQTLHNLCLYFVFQASQSGWKLGHDFRSDLSPHHIWIFILRSNHVTINTRKGPFKLDFYRSMHQFEPGIHRQCCVR